MEKIKIEIEPPRRGWALVRVSVEGSEVSFDASYVPSDSIGDLVSAASRLAVGLTEATVTWNSEPREYDFHFSALDGRTTLSIYAFPDARRSRRSEGPVIAMVETETIIIVHEIRRCLRQLQAAVPAEEYQRSWGYAFPESALIRLESLIRSGSS